MVSRPSGLTPTAGDDAPEEVLGPVDRIVLDGEGPVDVKAAGNAVGWGDSPTAQLEHGDSGRGSSSAA